MRRPTRYDYVKRDVMIPMRDGVKLHTVIVVPKGARNAPILLTRTPYNASARAQRNRSPSMVATLPLFDELFAADGYIRVYQDVRGKYGSEGEYVMTRPLRGPLNDTTVDHSTDAYDTIDWLVKNVPESNGRVGMVGSSYEGFTVVMALVNPHPALKVAVPESPMVDGWMGDDWFHYGAFRQVNLDYFTEQTTVRGCGDRRSCAGATTTTRTSGARARRATSRRPRASISSRGGARSPSIPPTTRSGRSRRSTRPWRAQPLTVPTIWLQGLWDQEDMWGAIHSYAAVEAEGHGERQELPRHGAVVSQPDQPRGHVARAAAVGDRHHARCPPRRPQAVLRSIPERRRAEGEHAAGPHLQHR